jgi:hypothetical protein
MVTTAARDRWLAAVVAKPSLNARWLNTIALMEYTGARKILKSQASSTVGEMLLRHAAEESRHAHFFKRASARVSDDVPTGFTADDLLCGEAAKAYFYHLDHGVEASLVADGWAGDDLHYACYLFVTTLIEERAGWLYPAYHRALRKGGTSVSLSGIIEEEDRHLEEMAVAGLQLDPLWLDRIERFREHEEGLWADLWTALEAMVARLTFSPQLAP